MVLEASWADGVWSLSLQLVVVYARGFIYNNVAIRKVVPWSI